MFYDIIVSLMRIFVNKVKKYHTGQYNKAKLRTNEQKRADVKKCWHTKDETKSKKY